MAIAITNKVSDDQDWYEPIPIYRAFLYSQISSNYSSIGDYKNAKISIKKAYEIKSELLDSNDTEIADSFMSLAFTSFAQSTVNPL